MVRSSFDDMMGCFDDALEWVSDSPYSELPRVVIELRDRFEELYGGDE